DLRDQGERADRRGVYRAGAAQPAHQLRAGRRVTATAGGGGSRLVDARWERGRQFLRTDLAILGGAMTWLSERHLVAAISNAGGFGVLACGAMSPDLLDAEIRATAARTDRPFGVNLIIMHPQLRELVDVCIAREVGHVVLAGGLPSRDTIGRLRGAGVQ